MKEKGFFALKAGVGGGGSHAGAGDATFEFGWALAGAFLRLPGVWWFVQVVKDASGLGPRVLAMLLEARQYRERMGPFALAAECGLTTEGIPQGLKPLGF